MGAIAEAFVAVRPDMSRFGPELVASTQQAGADAGPGLEKGLGDAAEEAGKTAGGRGAKSFTKAFGAIAAVSGVFTTLFGAITKGGEAARASQARLDIAIKGAGKTTAEYKEELKAAVDQGAKFGHNATQIRDSMTTLTRRLQDPTKALDALSLAEDIAAAKGIGLSAATGQAAKLLAGNSRAFKEYGISIGDVKKNQQELTSATEDSVKAQQKLADARQNLSDVEAILSEKVAKGNELTISDQQKLRDAKQDVTVAEGEQVTAAGRLAAANEAISKGLGSIDEGLGKVRTQLKNAAEKESKTMTGQLKEMKTIAKNLADDFGQKFGPALTVATGAITVLSGVASIISAVAIPGLIAGIGGAATAVAAFILPILAVAAVLAIVALVVVMWGDDIARIFKKVVGWVTEHIGTITRVLLAFATLGLSEVVRFVSGHLDDIVDFFKKLPGRLASIGSTIFDFIKVAFKTAINYVIKGWNALEFKIPGFSMGPIKFGGFTLGVPDIHPLAKGGVSSGPLLALLGDNPSGKEKVTPLDSWGRDLSGGGVVFGPGAIIVSFNGAVPSEAQAHATGQAVGRGVIAEMERADARRVRRAG